MFECKSVEISYLKYEREETVDSYFDLILMSCKTRSQPLAIRSTATTADKSK